MQQSNVITTLPQQLECLKCNAKLTIWIKWTLRLITKIACGNVDVRETSNNVKAIDGLYHKA